jgi:hypothetical protein
VLIILNAFTELSNVLNFCAKIQYVTTRHKFYEDFNEPIYSSQGNGMFKVV